MRIIYDDIIYSLQKAGGISTYWNELKSRIPGVESARDVSVWKRYFPVAVKSAERFIFHSSYYRWCKNKRAVNITTVHDFTYEYFRRDLKAIFHRWQKRQAVRHSAAVICVSENTRRDFRKFYPWYGGRIKVIYHGFSAEYRLMGRRRKNCFLFVGSRASYKNFPLAVEIAAKIPAARLIIVGGGGLTESERKLLDGKIGGRYEAKGFVPNGELGALYNEAKGLLYTSDYEGFGIPALEAQACGCPVLCQKKSSLPEVVGDSAVYVSGSDIAGSVLQAEKLLRDDSFFEQKQREGFENISRFSWDNCAAATKNFYGEVFSEINGGRIAGGGVLAARRSMRLLPAADTAREEAA